MADSSHNDYIADDYIDDYYTDTEFVVSLEGVFDLDVGTPGAARHRTAHASVTALQMAYWQPGSPFSPYDIQPVFVIHNHFGIYLFSTRGVPQVILDQVYSFETTLIEPDPVAFNSVPLHGNVVGSVSSIQRPVGHVRIRDPEAIWLRKLSREATLTMGAGLFWIVRRVRDVPALTGTIGRITWQDFELDVEYGDFRRRTPVRRVLVSV